jgi:hypothetical protein
MSSCDPTAVHEHPSSPAAPAPWPNWALTFAGSSRVVHPVLVNGAAGVVVTMNGRPVSVMAFTVTQTRIVAIYGLSDRERLNRLNLVVVAELGRSS